jgi:AcrR family transcriptional regulator
LSEKLENYHKGNLKQTLISAGLEILSRDGMDVLSLRMVAKKAGVSHAAPYRHFNNKEALIAAIAEEGFNRLSIKIAEAANLYPGQSELQLKEAGWGYVQFALENPEHLKVMFGSFSSECAPDKGTSMDYLIGLIKNCQEEGLIENGDPVLLALTTWSTVHGLALIYINGQMPEVGIAADRTSQEQLTRKIIDTLFEGLKKR